MKSWVTIALSALFLSLLAPFASAQDGLPTSVTQAHAARFDWGYVGLQPQLGLWLSDRFNVVNAAASNFGWQNGELGNNAMLGAKAVLGFGSTDSQVGTEFFVSLLRQSYGGTEDPDLVAGSGDEREVTIDQHLGKFGFNIMYEFLSNEAITSTGEVTKDRKVGITGFAGLYWLFFFRDDDFQIDRRNNPGGNPALGGDTTIEDDTLWFTLGLTMEIPFSNFLSLAVFAKMESYIYQLERITFLSGLIGKNIDRGQYNFEFVTEKFQAHLGAFVTVTPFFNTHDDHHWRFYAGVTFIITESSISNVLMFTLGFNFGW